MKVFIELLLYLVSFLVPKKNYIVFGAWNGKKFGDNPGYLAMNLSEQSDYKLFWVGDDSIKEDVPSYLNFLDINDSKTKWKLMRMKYAFVSHSYADLCSFNVFGNTKVILMWHGVGIKALKNLKSESKIRAFIRSILRRYDYFLASSEADQLRTIELFSEYGASKDNVLLTGQTRVQMFTDRKYNSQEVKQSLYNKFRDKFWVVYMPTFREDLTNEFSFLSLSQEKQKEIEEVLKKNNAILLEKRHPGSKCKSSAESQYIFNISEDENDIQILLTAADLLITDYSSVAFDYVLLDRPIIHFIYDFEDYTNGSSGLYYDFEDIRAGVAVKSWTELLEEIHLSLKFPMKDGQRRKKVCDTMLKYDDGRATDRIIDYFDLKKGEIE